MCMRETFRQQAAALGVVFVCLFCVTFAMSGKYLVNRFLTNKIFFSNSSQIVKKMGGGCEARVACSCVCVSVRECV